jgi:LemA protein
MQAYSDLKAMELYTASFGELSSTENKVAFSCQAFNDAVTSYNTYKKQTFLSFF